MVPTANVAMLRLSGSDKLYAYLIDHLAVWPKPGQRVVVPSKLKEDGTVSLAIGTVDHIVQYFALDPAVQYKVVAQVLDDAALEYARGSLLPPITGSMNAVSDLKGDGFGR